MSGTLEGDGTPPRRPRLFPEAERRAAPVSAPELEPLMTVCPQCGTRFRVTEAQLQAARGQVRCGACGSIFNGVDQLVLDAPREFTTRQDAERALDELMDELLADSRVVLAPREGDLPRTPAPEAESEWAPAAEPADEPAEPWSAQALVAPAVVYAVSGAAPQSSPARPPLTDAEGPAVAAATEAPSAPVAPSPFSDAVVFGPPRRRRRWWLWPLALLGALVVAAQFLWFRFDDLVRDPAWRPIYAQICTWTGCELPIRRAPALIRPRNLTVQSAAVETGELTVRVLIVNEAEFPQPFPALELRFSELNGAVVAGYRFLPSEYLAGDARNLELMPVRTPVQLELSIPDPGPHAVNYQLDLR